MPGWWILVKEIKGLKVLLQKSIEKISCRFDNYLIKALLGKGMLKVDNFRKSDNKVGYLYLLTPEGVERRRKLTMLFLQRKSEEFDKLKKELIRMNNK